MSATRAISSIPAHSECVLAEEVRVNVNGIGTRARVVVAIVVAVVALWGCGGDSTSPGTGPLPVGTGAMAARVGGSSWNATQVIAVRGQDGTIGVSGTDVSTYNVAFHVKAAAGGSYPIPDCTGPGGSDTGTNAGAATRWPAAGTGVWGSDCTHNGSVTITSLTADGVSGTFNFELAAAPGSGATGGLSVSAGTFSAKF
jgi:hypothetical protein